MERHGEAMGHLAINSGEDHPVVAAFAGSKTSKIGIAGILGLHT
jgi:hypothetical protein